MQLELQNLFSTCWNPRQNFCPPNILNLKNLVLFQKSAKLKWENIENLALFEDDLPHTSTSLLHQQYDALSLDQLRLATRERHYNISSITGAAPVLNRLSIFSDI
ncbi:unnamed protein product, partial [Nesidiocoris tenuis]